jgi:hypothetical protein
LTLEGVTRKISMERREQAFDQYNGGYAKYWKSTLEPQPGHLGTELRDTSSSRGRGSTFKAVSKDQHRHDLRCGFLSYRHVQGPEQKKNSTMVKNLRLWIRD